MKKKDKPPLKQRIKAAIFGIKPPLFFDNHIPKQQPNRAARRSN